MRYSPIAVGTAVASFGEANVYVTVRGDCSSYQTAIIREFGVVSWIKTVGMQI
jgi:hypothetical protein